MPDLIWPARLLFQETGGLPVSTPGLPPGFGLVIILVLIFLNGFFVATEFSLVASRRSRIEQLVSEGNSAAVAVKRAIAHLDTYIATTQLGITMASLALGWVGESALAVFIDPFLSAVLPSEWTTAASNAISVGISFIVITILTVVLGEFAPKGMSIQRAESVAMFVVRPTTLFLTVFKPFVLIINSLGNSVLRLLGLATGSWETNIHSVEELRYMVKSSTEAGILETAEADIVNRALNLGDLTAHSVMVPRTEMVSVPIDITKGELLSLAGRERHVRFPVYGENTDDIVGIIYLTDIFAYEDEHPGEPFNMLSILRRPLLVPESIKGDQLLAQMRTARTHTAIVVDEFGGVAGIVTLQDLLERIVGQIPELDEGGRSDVETLPDGSVRIDGLTPLTEVGVRFALKLEESEAETVGGYVLETLGRVPKVGEELEIPPYTLRVAEMDGPRVAQVVLRKQGAPESVEFAETD